MRRAGSQSAAFAILLGLVALVAPDGTQSVLASGLPSFGLPEGIGPAGNAVAADGTIWLANGGAGLFTVNRGFASHDLRIDALDISSPRVRPGRTETLVITAPPGDYLAYCSVTGHRAHSMVGTVRAVRS